MDINKIYSHSDKTLLYDHLAAVAVESARIQPIYSLKPLSCIIGALHDFGKMTTFFQSKIRGDIRNSGGDRANHAFFSAIVAYNIVKTVYSSVDEKMLPDNNRRETPLIQLLYFMAFNSIYLHHTDLKGIDEVGKSVRSKIEPVKNDKSILLDQANDIIGQGIANKEMAKVAEKLEMYNLADIEIPEQRWNFEEKVCNHLGIKFQKQVSFSQCKKILTSTNFDEILKKDNIKRTLEEIRGIGISSHEISKAQSNSECPKCVLFSYLYLIFSVLIDSDKRKAAKIKSNEKRINIPFKVVDDYIGKKIKKESKASPNMKDLREALYSDVNEEVKNIDLDKEKIFTITAPTGAGKTLASFSFALRLRDRIKKEKAFIPRIIYSLPFISIIDQNYGVLRNVLSFGFKKDFEDNESAYIIPHHHLAPIQYKNKNEERSIEESLMYVESWDSEIIVTTFEQFLYSVIAYKNKFLKKYHNIFGSIIILDEVQNISGNYWNVVGYVLKTLAETMDCRIILMTATQPFIISGAKELFRRNKQFFNKVNRTTFSYKSLEVGSKNKATANEDKDEEIAKRYEEITKGIEDDKSYLFVLNTIASATRLYKTIIKYFPNVVENPDKIEEIGTLRPVFYLSSHIVPYQRIKRINMIKELIKKGRKPILVSTQVVEAGVELDFEAAFRDIGPIDSIIQVGGRCNRSWTMKDKGHVTVAVIDNKTNLVYGKVLPHITEKILKANPTFDEPKVLQIVEQYFEEVKDKIIDSKKSLNVIKHLQLLKFDKLNKEFKLIADEDKVPIFVTINDKAENEIRQFEDEMKEAQTYLEKHKIYLKHRNALALYTINVSDRDTYEEIKKEEAFYYKINRDQLQEFYDIETGYIKP